MRRMVCAMPGTMAGMPKKPVISTNELARMLWQAEAQAGDVLMQQMLDRLGQQTFVGGKRVAIQPLPRLPKQAATTVPSRGSPTRAAPAGGGRRRRRTAAGSGPSTSTRPSWMTRSTPTR